MLRAPARQRMVSVIVRSTYMLVYTPRPDFSMIVLMVRREERVTTRTATGSVVATRFHLALYPIWCQFVATTQWTRLRVDFASKELYENFLN